MKTAEAPKYPSPLWIIALFITLSEMMAGTAAIATTGSTQLIFALFAVVFPLLVLGTFIRLLIRYPAHLYGPWQYTSEVGIETYAEALSRQFRTASKVYSEATMDALAYAGEARTARVGSEEGLTKEAVAKHFEEVVERNSITVDRSKLISGATPVQIPVTEHTTVADLLDTIYFEISPAVHPFTYGSSWLLIDEAGTMLTNMGTRWAGYDRDERTLNEVGIHRGSRLEVVRPPYPKPSHLR